MKPRRIFFLLPPAILLAAMLHSAQAQIPAFPGAEGAGALATGGRGGSVYVVTNLNLSGPGSFAQAVGQPNRIVVFAVSGIIELGAASLKLTKPNLTVAGQTAPGEGICFRGEAVRVLADNVILTHLRFRRGFKIDGDTGDAFAADPDPAGTMTSNVMLAHLSASWATDESLSVQGPNLTTAQYCIASEGLDYANPSQTPPNHSEGSLWGTVAADGRVSMHHMLYAHNRLRNPRVAPGDHLDRKPPPVADFRNSVIYNARELTSHVGEEVVWMNWVGNFYKDGPDTGPTATQTIFTFGGDPAHRLHALGNHVAGSAAKTADNWLAMRYQNGLTEASVRSDTAFAAPAVTTESALAAYENVLENAGAILPARDAVDLRIVTDVQNGTGRIIDKETDLPADQRWPDYRALPQQTDSDSDGLPDFWETQFGLNPNVSTDSAALTPNGYANIEHYFNNTDPQSGATPIVHVGAMVSRAHTAKEVPGRLRVRRSGETALPLTVSYTASGTAAAGTDYVTLPGTITIPAGARWADIAVLPLSQAVNDRTLVLTLDTGSAALHAGCPRASLVVFVRDPDTDGDGMPDAWEQAHGLDASDPADATPDLDGDGFTNRQEYGAATDPRVQASVLRVTAASRSGSDVLLHFTTAPSRAYQVERCEDLDGGAWTVLPQNLFGTGGVVAFVDPGGATAPSRFYRVRVMQ